MKFEKTINIFKRIQSKIFGEPKKPEIKGLLEFTRRCVPKVLNKFSLDPKIQYNVTHCGYIGYYEKKTNPYKENTLEFDYWQHGWYEAKYLEQMDLKNKIKTTLKSTN